MITILAAATALLAYDPTRANITFVPSPLGERVERPIELFRYDVEDAGLLAQAPSTDKMIGRLFDKPIPGLPKLTISLEPLGEESATGSGNPSLTGSPEDTRMLSRTDKVSLSDSYVRPTSSMDYLRYERQMMRLGQGDFSASAYRSSALEDPSDRYNRLRSRDSVGDYGYRRTPLGR